MSTSVAEELQKPPAERAFPRRPAKGTVLCRMGKLGLGRSVKGKLLDLSPDGAGFWLEKEVAFGCTLELEMLGIGIARPILADAEVRYVASVPAGGWHVGVQFSKRLPHAELANLFR